jgi:hypothetical protein
MYYAVTNNVGWDGVMLWSLLQGVGHEIFDFWFFCMNQFPPDL